MKYLLQVSIIMLLMHTSHSFSYAQSPLKSIETSLATKDISTLQHLFSEKVDLSILNSEDTYKPREAANKIAFFFRIHKVSHFEIRHQGSSSISQFAIGDLFTEDGIYEVYFVLKRGKIVELTIDR